MKDLLNDYNKNSDLYFLNSDFEIVMKIYHNKILTNKDVIKYVVYDYSNNFIKDIKKLFKKFHYVGEKY